MPSSSFTYQPLDAKKGSIRVIEVLPDLSTDGKVQCALRHTSIWHDYTCLSYMWGVGTRNLPTILLNYQLGEVRRNLFTFLEFARVKYPCQSLWIDAICINQDDDNEKASQVQQMGDIYKEACRVISWLGRDSTISKFFRTVHQKPNDQFSWEELPPWHVRKKDRAYWGLEPDTPWANTKITRSNNSIDQILAHDFAVNKYWKRAWITQEVSLARKLLLATDQEQLDYALISGRLNQRQTIHLPRSNLKGKGVAQLLSVSQNKECLHTLKSCDKSLCLCTIWIVDKTLGLDYQWSNKANIEIPVCQGYNKSDILPAECKSKTGLCFDLSSICQNLRGKFICYNGGKKGLLPVDELVPDCDSLGVTNRYRALCFEVPGTVRRGEKADDWYFVAFPMNTWMGLVRTQGTALDFALHEPLLRLNDQATIESLVSQSHSDFEYELH
ncbi:hypothetical protein P154DRAFT_583794 [Amniculicola lignicola CBS 123094]|uniref:Heterokaryon incompatibility domain-containing protein n=1 Tax=Amniculicola lignicola CBS 123094 TaxID=1392246 RepID=A0A6A5X402_9PLEO|nr:hypothetical protein P154DRAFT_583794 [Amniculicola lignicola CBS 123094]